MVFRFFPDDQSSKTTKLLAFFSDLAYVVPVLSYKGTDLAYVGLDLAYTEPNLAYTGPDLAYGGTRSRLRDRRRGYFSLFLLNFQLEDTVIFRIQCSFEERFKYIYFLVTLTFVSI